MTGGGQRKGWGGRQTGKLQEIWVASIFQVPSLQQPDYREKKTGLSCDLKKKERLKAPFSLNPEGSYLDLLAFY